MRTGLRFIIGDWATLGSPALVDNDVGSSRILSSRSRAEHGLQVLLEGFTRELQSEVNVELLEEVVSLLESHSLAA